MSLGVLSTQIEEVDQTQYFSDNSHLRGYRHMIEHERARTKPHEKFSYLCYTMPKDIAVKPSAMSLERSFVDYLSYEGTLDGLLCVLRHKQLC